MVADILLSILLISPVPFRMLQRNQSAESMLIHILVVPVPRLVASYSRKQLANVEPVTGHQWNAVADGVVQILLRNKLHMLRLLCTTDPKISFLRDNNNSHKHSQHHDRRCSIASKLISIPNRFSFQASNLAIIEAKELKTIPYH